MSQNISKEKSRKMSFTPFIYMSSLEKLEFPIEPTNSDILAFRAKGSENYFFTDFERDSVLESELIRFMMLLEREHLNVTYPSYERLASYIGDKSHPFSFSKEVKGALNLVLVSLKAYYEASNPVLAFQDLKFWSVSLEGSAFLKKVRKKCIVKYLMGTFYEEPTWINEVPEYTINEIGDIFNYQYCFPWKAVDDKDYQIAFTECKPSKKYLDLFREKTASLLETASPLTKVDPLEILLNVSSSVAQSNGKKTLHYLGKSNNLNFSKKRSPGRRTFITTAPSDGRDAIINEIEDLNTIQWIDQQVSVLLEDSFSDYLVEKDSTKFEEKYTEFIEKYNFFIMRDIKKEGLQKPKVLLKIMLEELTKRFPEVFTMEITEFYDGPWFEGDTTDRGHGLGMANALTTLMQIVLYSLLIEELSRINMSIEIDMICHNDDIIFGINTDEDIDDVINLDCKILEKLGILVSRDKSFWSPIGGIICERYQNKCHNLHPKESYVLREKLLLFTSYNVTHMKSLLSAFYYKFEHEIDLRELISYFGYEFCPEEFEFPIDMGGWRRSKAFKVSFELKNLEENFDPKLIRTYLANKINKIELKKRKVSKFTPPVLQMFPNTIFEGIPSHVKLGLNILSDKGAYTNFTRIKKEPLLRQKAWDNLYKKRVAKFKEPAPPLTLEQIAKIVMLEPRNIFPPDILIDRWVDIKIVKERLRDPYDVPNPVCCALKKLGLISDKKFNSSFWPLEAKSNDSIKKASRRKDLARVLNFVPPVYGFEDYDTVLPKNPEDFRDFWLSYPAPLLMGKVCEIYGKIPILKKEYFWYSKLDVWDFDIGERELYFYNKFPFDLFSTIVKFTQYCNISYSEFVQVYEQVKKEKTQKPIPQKEYVFESDDEFDMNYAEELRNFTFDYPTFDEEPEEQLVTTLSWEESWETVSNIEEKDSTSFDPIYYSLDDTMKEIVDQVKEIYQLREYLNYSHDDERAETLKTKICDFCDTYPDFLILFGLEDPRVEREEESDDEGAFGDFDIQ